MTYDLGQKSVSMIFKSVSEHFGKLPAVSLEYIPRSTFHILHSEVSLKQFLLKQLPRQ